MRSRFALCLKRYPLTSSLSSIAKKPKVLLHQLTSSVFDTTADGNYSWNVIGMLDPHETLRRELGRGTKALNNFNLQFRPHQAYCFREWFETFMRQGLIEHEEVEKKLLWPTYHPKGVRVPLSFVDDHERFLDILQITLDAAIDLDNFNKADCVDNKVLESKVLDLKNNYGHLVDLAHRRYADEERFWPHHLEKHGETFFNEYREKVGEFLHKEVPESFLIMPCAQLACMGIAIEGSSFVIEPEADQGWAGDVLRERYLKLMHKELRTVILPNANKPYMAFRTLIDGCSADINMQEIDSKIQQIMQ